MVFDQEGIGQKNEAAQKEVVDQKNEKDVPDITFNVDQLGKGNLGG
jgi:hypothetical protein